MPFFALALSLAIATDPYPAGMPLSADDLLRFPSARVAQRMADVALAHQNWCRLRQTMAANEVERRRWEAAIQDAAERHYLWDTLANAHASADGVTPSYFRACLIGLRDQLGLRAWWHGEMPPPVPYWRIGR